MAELRRLRLKSTFTEASALLPVRSPDLLARLGVEHAWWLAHDEAGVSNLVSLVCAPLSAASDDSVPWTVVPVLLSPEDGAGSVTDAEAMAHTDGVVFVFGSAFTNRKGKHDDRRAFVARFAEDDVEIDHDGAAVAPVQTLELGTAMASHIDESLTNCDIALMSLADDAAKKFAKSQSDECDVSGTNPVNIEGAAFLKGSLVLGLRWPVGALGQPLLVVIDNVQDAMLAEHWQSDRVFSCPTTVRAVDDVGSPKRPAGVRAMAVVDERLHVVCGPTERDIAAKRTRSARPVHVSIDIETGRATEVQSFEGFRKVEALASGPGRSDWVYALDDEDAVVLLVSSLG